MAADPARRHFGRYELLEQIGSGGMGEVYRARDLDLQRDVAIKFISERLPADAHRIARFAQEARTASSLNHPAILTIHEIGQTDGRPFIVMELVPGRTLRQILQQGRLSPKRALDIAAQVAAGLANAHEAGIVHRDVKPENIMVTPEGFAKILDFGLAKLRGSDAPGAAASGNASTRAATETVGGGVVGTASYMAPEQALGAAVDHRADQFALGAMLYEMATGRRAFRRDSFVQTLSAVIDSEPAPIASIAPAFPEQGCAIAVRCLSKDPDDRYASTRDLAHDLRALREQAAESRSSATALSASLRRAGLTRRRGSMAGVTLVGLLALLFAGAPDALWRWISGPPSVRLAVLLNGETLSAGDRERIAPLVDYSAVRLAELHRLRSSFSVVPVADLRDAQVRGPAEALKRTGATVTASLTAHRAGDDLVIAISLDERGRVLGGEQLRFSGGMVSEEAVVEAVVEAIGKLLRVPLEAHERAAWASAASGVAEARTLFAQALSQTPPYQSGLSELERLDQEPRVARAIELFNRAIELDPRYADAHARLGEAYVLLYRLTRHAEHLQLAGQNADRAREIDPTRPAAWITLGMIHAERQAFDRAEEAFEQARVRSPGSDALYRELGRVQHRAGALDRAEASFRRAIELNPDSWSNHNHLGVFLHGTARLDEAEAAFRAALAQAPENARVWANLGGLQFARGRVDEAERTLETAVSFYDHGAALSNLATLKFRARRQYAEAARLFERAAQLAPRDHRIWRNLAAAYHWTPGQRDRAAEPLRRAAALLDEALQAHPASAVLLVRLADVRAKQGDEHAARRLLEQALATAPVDRDVAALAAGIMEALGDRGAALRHAGAALAAGVTEFEFRSDPAFERLVADPRFPPAPGVGRPGNPQ